MRLDERAAVRRLSLQRVAKKPTRQAQKRLVQERLGVNEEASGEASRHEQHYH